MTYTSGDVRLANAALALLAEENLVSFSEPSDLGGKVEAIYAGAVRAQLAAYPWRFTLTKRQLSLLAAAPTSEWQYQHQLPADLLMLRALRPSATPGAATITEYEIFSGNVLSNNSEVWADFQIAQPPETWPAPFYKMMTHALASDLAMVVTGSTTLANYHFGIAFGSPQQAGSGGWNAAARRADSQQQPPQRFTRFTLLNARNGGAA